MKWFEIRMVVAAVFGLLMLSGLNAPPAHADFTFGEPVVVDWAIPIFESWRSWDGWQCFSYDGLEMYITSAVLPGGYGDFDLWVLKRASVDDEWGPPENLGPEINSPVEDSLASISADGLTLYFCSPRPDGHGDYDVYMTTRPTRDDPWGPAVNLGPPVNSSHMEGCPWISPDGLELYFQSDRPGGSGLSDLWVSRRPTTSDPWGEPVNLGPGVNSPAHDGYPSLSPDGLLLLFNDHPWGQGRPGGYGGLDIWIARRTSLADPWQDAVNAGPMVNGSGPDLLPRIWPDGRTLYFWRQGQGLLAAPILPVVDFNGDGKVDMADLLRLIENWGTDNPLYDIGPYAWGDGKVDAADLEVLMSYWDQELYDPTLVGHWPLDETAGNIAHDLAGGNNATILGLPQWQPEGGKIDGALQLNGMTCGTGNSPVNPAGGPFSVLAWVKGGAPGQVLVSQAGQTNWLMADPLQGTLMTELVPPAGRSAAPPLVSESVVTDGNWHRIAFTWDGASRRLYVDGDLVAEDVQDGLAGSFDNLIFGAGKAMTAGTYWTGLIDEVRLYNRVVRP